MKIDFSHLGGMSRSSRSCFQYSASFAAAMKVDWKAGKPVFKDAPGVMLVDVMFGADVRSRAAQDVRQGRAGAVPDKIDPKTGKPEKTFAMPMSEPAGFPQEQLDEWFGPNQIMPRRCTTRAVLSYSSSFGIVYNWDILRELGLDELRRVHWTWPTRS